MTSPAWVAWRSGGGYLGWAPLPSSVGFTDEGLGLGAAVLTAGFFTFVAEQNILYPRVATVILPSTRNVIIVENTTNITRYEVSDHRVFNRGIDVHQIEKVTGHPVRTVRIAELNHAGAHGRGAFYQPAVVTRAAAAHHAEFGLALRAQRAAQRENQRESQGPRPGAPRTFSPAAPGANHPRPDKRGVETPGTDLHRPQYDHHSGTPYSPAPAAPPSQESQPQHYTPGPGHPAHTAPQQPPHHATSPPPPPPAKSEPKPQPKKSDDKDKHKPPV